MKRKKCLNCKKIRKEDDTNLCHDCWLIKKSENTQTNARLLEGENDG